MPDSAWDEKPNISCIVCHHTGDLIHGFLDSIMKSKGVNFEVLVVTSDSSFIPKICDDRIHVYNHKGMPAAKRNFGSQFAAGDYIAFFDDDTEINENCLKRFKEHLKNEDCSMVYGKLWNMEHKNRFDEAGGFLTWTGFIWSRAAQNDVDKGQYDYLEYILAGKSASCMVIKKHFREIGGFDESFGILGEETDLSWRLWLKNYKVLFCPDACGYHAFNTKFKPPEKYYTSSRVHFNGCRNYITMLIKNLGKEHLWIIPIHSVIWFFASIAMLITGKLRQGINIQRGLVYVLLNLKSILGKRSQIQRGRKVSDKTLWHSIYKLPPRGYCWSRFRKYLSTGLHG